MCGLECFAKHEGASQALRRGAGLEVLADALADCAGLEASRPEWLTMPEVLPDAVHKVWD